MLYDRKTKLFFHLLNCEDIKETKANIYLLRFKKLFNNPTNWKPFDYQCIDNFYYHSDNFNAVFLLYQMKSTPMSTSDIFNKVSSIQFILNMDTPPITKFFDTYSFTNVNMWSKWKKSSV